MSDTIHVEVDVPEETTEVREAPVRRRRRNRRRSFWNRLTRRSRNGARRTRRGARRSRHYVARKARQTGRAIKRGAKATGRFLKRAAKATGRAVRRTIGYIGLAASWVVLLALRIAQFAFHAVWFILTGVAALALLGYSIIAGWITWLMLKVRSLFRDWVYDFFGWLTFRQPSGHRVTFKEYRLAMAMDRENRVRSRFENRVSYWRSRLVEPVLDLANTAVGTEDVIEDPIPEAPEPGDNTLVVVTARDRKVAESLTEKTRLQVQADLDNADEAFPGAKATQVAENDPYTAKGTSYEPDNVILVTMGKWLDKHPEKTPVDFVFEHPWSHEDQREALTMLRGSANTGEERSYWAGRFEALQMVSTDPRYLEEHGRGWALIHSQLRSSGMHLSSLRSGYADQIRDMKVQRDKQPRPVRV